MQQLSAKFHEDTLKTKLENQNWKKDGISRISINDAKKCSQSRTSEHFVTSIVSYKLAHLA